MTLYQILGVWVAVAGFALFTLTAALVAFGLAWVQNVQDERRYGLRRGWSRPEAGVGGDGAAGDGPSDRETLARVGWVGIERITK